MAIHYFVVQVEKKLSSCDIDVGVPRISWISYPSMYTIVWHATSMNILGMRWMFHLVSPVGLGTWCKIVLSLSSTVVHIGTYQYNMTTSYLSHSSGMHMPSMEWLCKATCTCRICNRSQLHSADQGLYMSAHMYRATGQLGNPIRCGTTGAIDHNPQRCICSQKGSQLSASYSCASKFLMWIKCSTLFPTKDQTKP